jgi:hypothetical protein
MATAEKTSICLGLEMNSLFHVLNLAKNKKNILAFEYCRFGPTTLKKIHLNIRLWNLQRSTESVNKRAKDGANTTIISLG